MAPINVWQSACICNYFRLVIYNVTLCTQTCCAVKDVVIAIMWSTTAVRSRLDGGRCVLELTWVIDISFKQQDWSLCDLPVALPLCPDSCVWSICGFIDLDHTISLAPDFVIHSCVYYLLQCSHAFFVHPDTTLILQSSCSCRARQVAWSLGGWILRHLRGCFVQILFKEPTFLVGTGSVSLLLLCDMIQRLYLFLSSLWYSQRGRGSQRQPCLPDHWLCRKAQQCQKRIAVCCHCADVI